MIVRRVSVGSVEWRTVLGMEVGIPEPDRWPVSDASGRRGTPGSSIDRMGARRAIVEARRDEINELVHRHHGRSASLFGSAARGDDDADSDVDFLVEFEPGSSLFDLMDLQEALEKLLQARVDVVSAGGLKDRDEHIRREAVPI